MNAGRLLLRYDHRVPWLSSKALDRSEVEVWGVTAGSCLSFFLLSFLTPELAKKGKYLHRSSWTSLHNLSHIYLRIPLCRPYLLLPSPRVIPLVLPCDVALSILAVCILSLLPGIISFTNSKRKICAHLQDPVRLFQKTLTTFSKYE